jgi:hypothetical protein
MADNSTTVGAAIAAALERGEQLRKASPRRPRVRIMTVFGDDHSGLTVNARIAARTDEELMAQQNVGTRRILWADLDVRAAELVTLVDEVVSEVETAIRDAPVPVGHARKSESDLDLETYEAVTEACYEGLIRSALDLLATPGAKRLSQKSGQRSDHDRRLETCRTRCIQRGHCSGRGAGSASGGFERHPYQSTQRSPAPVGAAARFMR